MQTLRTLFLTLLILLPASADAARLAVLEINDLEIEQKVLAQISDGLREGALDTIRGSDADISVMTRESMLMMLDDMGIDPSCIEGECEVETARNIGADYVISATLLKLEGVWILSAKLHESEGGDLLATGKTEANGLLDLSRATPAVASSLLAKGLGLYASSSAVSTSAVSGTEGKIGGGSQLMSSSRSSIVTFESTPPGAVVMLDGRLICPATPCSKQVAEGSHRVSMQVEQYHAAEETVTISKDRTVSLSLKAAFATLKINTVPGGLPISFGGEQQGKGSINERVNPGVYEVTVETPCYALTGERVVLNEGDSRSLTITPPVREAGVEISVTDEAGNAVRATVYADGVEVGSAPGQAVVPLCTKELKVESADGMVWTGTAKLREGEYVKLPVVVKSGLPHSVPRSLVATSLTNSVDIKRCFYNHYKETGARPPPFIVQFEVASNGTVVVAYITTPSLKNQAIDTCVSATIKKIQFPPISAASDMINYTFVLNEKSGNSTNGTSSGYVGVTLTTDDQIVSMVGRVLDRQTPLLRSCYERRLATKRDLQGIWVIGLTVNKDGSVSDVAVTAQEQADDELERCIQSRVLGWSFQPIIKALPVNKIVSFTPR
jgi:hypothetical protein